MITMMSIWPKSEYSDMHFGFECNNVHIKQLEKPRLAPLGIIYDGYDYDETTSKY